MCIEDAPHLHVVDCIVLTKQCTAKGKKEELMQQKRSEAATEIYINTLYYFDIFFLRDMLEDSMQAWEDFSTSWSKNGKAFSPNELTTHLKMMISKTQSQVIPTKPPVKLSTRKAQPLLGTQMPDVTAMYANL
eukprot:13898633-Ditylum_brightwellii.AAC.1